LKLICEELLSDFAFNFNLRRYIAGEDEGVVDGGGDSDEDAARGGAGADDAEEWAEHSCEARPGRYCSPRHYMQFISRSQGSNCVG